MVKGAITFKDEQEVLAFYEKDKESNRVVLYGGTVYHVAEYMPQHPGGEQYIEDNLGKNIEEAFEDAEHTKSAKNVLLALPVVGHLESYSDSASTDSNEKHKNAEGVDGYAIESKISFDYDKALMYQVFQATWTFDEYVQYINEPKHLVNPVRGIKLFDNVILEQLTQSPWYGIPGFNIPLICFLLYTAGEHNYNMLQIAGIMLAGAFTWTWVEYTLHRYFFHGEDYWMDKLPHNKYVWYFHFLIHGIHHAFPQDHFRLVFPPVPGFLVLGIFGYLPQRMIVPSDALNFFYSGFLIGYIMYDMMHYFLHHSSPKEGSWWQMMKIYHMQHHYKWGAIGFGVSSKFWDYVYDTAIDKNNKAKQQAAL